MYHYVSIAHAYMLQLLAAHYVFCIHLIGVGAVQQDLLDISYVSSILL